MRVCYGIIFKQVGSLAQPGEHLPYKQRVIGSIPIASTNTARNCLLCGNSSVVERHLAKVNVAGSSLVSRSKYSSALFFWRYSQVVRQGSAKPLFPGSNPGGASIEQPPFGAVVCVLAAAPRRNSVTRLTLCVTIAIPSRQAVPYKSGRRLRFLFTMVRAFWEITAFCEVCFCHKRKRRRGTDIRINIA